MGNEIKFSIQSIRAASPVSLCLENNPALDNMGAASILLHISQTPIMLPVTHSLGKESIYGHCRPIWSFPSTRVGCR